MKRGTPDHPKTLDLAQRLQIPRYAAVGLLECLWHFTGKYAPQGDVGRWSDENIANGVYWTGDPRALVAALAESEWLDESQKHRLLVHDWHDHADEAVKKLLARKGLPFLTEPRRVSRRVETQPPPTDGHVEPAVAVASAVAVARASALPEGAVDRDKEGASEREAFRTIADEFYRIRGSDLPPLSSLDYAQAMGWLNSGIPLRIVLRGMQDCAGAKTTKPRSLAYFSPAVEEARVNWRATLGPHPAAPAPETPEPVGGNP